MPPPSATRPRSTSTSSTDRGIAIEAPRLLEVGRIDRPHGVRGEVVGLAVVDQHGHGHGRVRAVVENPASDLLELEDGRLVPSVFVVDHQPGERLVVEVPDGLLDDRD